jgi:acetolactate synthase I/III small subunit
MTIVVDDQGSPQIMEQVEKQLNKLVNVIKVQDFSSGESVDRELILVKVKTTTTTRLEILEIARIFRARVVDISRNSVVLEITGADDKIKAILELLSRFGIKELVRAGKIAIARS